MTTSKVDKEATMKKSEAAQLEGRRNFLKMASVGSVAGAAAAVVGSGDAQAAPTENAGTGGSYRETAHVKKVYDLARF